MTNFLSDIFGKGKILGREPTLWIAVLVGFINLLVGFQLDFLSVEQASAINVLISAIGAFMAAVATRPIAPQVLTYSVTAVFGVMAAYGLDFNQEQVSSIQTFLLLVMALITRNQVSPIEDAHRTGVLGNK